MKGESGTATKKPGSSVECEMSTPCKAFLISEFAFFQVKSVFVSVKLPEEAPGAS